VIVIVALIAYLPIIAHLSLKLNNKSPINSGLAFYVSRGRPCSVRLKGREVDGTAPR